MSTSFSYGVVFTGDSTGYQQAQQQVVEGLQEVTQYSITFGETQERVSQVSIRGIQQMIFGTQMLIWIGGMAYTGMMRQEGAAIAVEQAQENLNHAIAQYGANSTQARRAARSLERAQLYVARANQMATFSMFSLGLQIVQAGLYFVRYLPQLTAWVSSMWSLAAAQAALKPWLVPAMVAGAAAVGGIAAGYAISQSTTVNVNINQDTDLSSAFDEAKRKATYELRRAG